MQRIGKMVYRKPVARSKPARTFGAAEPKSDDVVGGDVYSDNVPNDDVKPQQGLSATKNWKSPAERSGGLFRCGGGGDE